MSTRSNRAREAKAPKTNPKWYPVTQGLNRWVNKMAERSDLTMRVLKHTNGAPARFVPSEAEIDLNEALIARIDPIIAGSPEFVVKHRSTAGALVHEACHARCSHMIDLARITKIYGERHAGVFAMLEEGRCETQTWPHLNGVEKLALQSMVLEIVLRDMQDEEGGVPPLDMAAVVRLMGLLAARINTGIVDTSQPMGQRMQDALIKHLGVEYAPLFDIAVKFSQIPVSWYDNGEARLNDLTRQWIEVEDRLVPPSDEGGSGGDKGEDSEEEGDGKGDGKGKGKGESKPSEPEPGDGDEGDDGDGEGDEPGDGDESNEDGGGKGQGKGDEPGGGDESENLPGDDDEGKVGDGSHTLTEKDAKGDASLGQYSSSNVDAGEFADIFKAVHDAAEEAESVGGSRLREEIVSIHRADASAHAERRRKNAVAGKRWR